LDQRLAFWDKTSPKRRGSQIYNSPWKALIVASALALWAGGAAAQAVAGYQIDRTFRVLEGHADQCAAADAEIDIALASMEAALLGSAESDVAAGYPPRTAADVRQSIARALGWVRFGLASRAKLHCGS
jgi:hypothetical protein